MISKKVIQQIKLFSKLPEAALLCIARYAVRQEFEAGALLLVADMPCEAAYFIVGGEVRVYRVSLSGREQVLTRLKAGQAFNTVPIFLPEGQNHANVMAVTPVTLLRISKLDFLKMLSECSDVALVVLREFAGRLEHLTNLVEDLSLRTVQGRVARFLLEQATTGDKLNQRWTHSEIATHLGTVRDMVGRAIRAFTDAGWIRMERGRIVILDRGALDGVVGE